MKSGAKILIEGLQREGVETIFGYPGGVVLPIYDELYNAPIRHILVRHEQAAAHAADGFARASGRVGVCLATSGPGACNLVTGIATAYMDSVPIVALTGQVPTNLLGNDAFQEADISGITMPVTKHSYLVKDTRELSRVVREAFYIARTGRPGPVLIDIPKDVSTNQVEDRPL
jgi:acetolactate synthase-1/2/3 large subunit